ncbi:MotA/TolQ/ExbB proton channel family protein [Marinospirillum sp. MEB164]|uniref:MotA/TolQ/ExbB proton channel family protein n=1 Tax=Marinospirillum alkalitolerans TaxID=3123374 RepID=A0ABW8PX77_9GAMM
MLEIFAAGGWLMWPLLLCSVSALTIILERLWALRQQSIAPTVHLEAVDQWPLAQLLARYAVTTAAPTSVERILQAGLRRHDQGALRIREALQAAGAHEVHQLEKYLTPLGSIAAITPLIGLLGTVVGMIDVFQQLDLAQGNAQQLAGGISVALITTATGLAIAIPSLVMHRYFQRRVSDWVVTLEQVGQTLLDRLSPDQSAALQLDALQVESQPAAASTTPSGWS